MSVSEVGEWVSLPKLDFDRVSNWLILQGIDDFESTGHTECSDTDAVFELYADMGMFMIAHDNCHPAGHHFPSNHYWAKKHTRNADLLTSITVISRLVPLAFERRPSVHPLHLGNQSLLYKLPCEAYLIFLPRSF